MRYYMDEPGEHSTKWKKSITLYNSIYAKYQIGKSIETESRWAAP